MIADGGEHALGQGGVEEKGAGRPAQQHRQPGPWQAGETRRPVGHPGGDRGRIDPHQRQADGHDRRQRRQELLGAGDDQIIGPDGAGWLADQHDPGPAAILRLDPERG